MPDSGPWRWLAIPLAKLWSFGAGVAHALADRGLPRAERASIPIISVGSLAFGGSGKTPISRWLARVLAARGERPAILLRGYRGRRGSESRIVHAADADGALDGDEAVLLATTLPGTLIIAGPDRARSAELAAAGGATVAILDDGHQHRRLARVLNLVIWDAGAERARRGAGVLREPLSGLQRANAMLLVDRGEGTPARPPQAPSRASSFRVRLVPRTPANASPNRPVYALTGIADPKGFEHALQRSALRIVGATRHADHHPFTAREIADAVSRARALGADAIATTAKDRARTAHLFEACGLETLVFDLDVESPDEESLAQAIARAIHPEDS